MTRRNRQALAKMTYLTGTMQPEGGQPEGQTGILHTTSHTLKLQASLILSQEIL